MGSQLTRKSLAACAVALAFAAVPGVAQAETLVNNTGDSVTVLGGGGVNRYPANLILAGADGPVTDVDVKLTVTHTRPEDLDVMVVSPKGTAVRLMVDACGGADLTSAEFTFDDAAPGELPFNNCLSGTYQPTVPGSATFPAPAPGGSGFELSDINGDNPNGRWELFVVDDAAGETGTISSWGLTVTTETSEIIIPAGPATSGVASSYPATQNVPTPDGTVIDDVDLLIPALNHSFPDDLDMLLQGPGGQSVMLMSDACSDADFNDRQTQFSDVGDPLTDATSGVCSLNFLVRPADFDEVESLPAPAPARPYASSLSVFKGLQASDWKLWINDDTNGDTGYLNGWGPEIITRPAATTGFASTAISTAEGQTASLTVTRSGPAELGPATLKVDIAHSGTTAGDLGPGVPTQLEFARGEASKTIAVPINSDFEGEGAEDFLVSLSNPVNDALLADATSFATVTIAASPPDNRFTVDKVKRLANGRARVSVTIPNPGTLAAEDSGPKDLLKPTEVNAEKAGQSVITLKPAKKAKRKLKRGKKVKLTAEVSYMPLEGLANSADVPVKLKRS